jgi:hypothetical protein
MNEQQLNDLVGLPLAEAETLVRAAGCEPRSLTQDEITISLSLPGNVVQLRYDDAEVVLSAETQASIDAKYS